MTCRFLMAEKAKPQKAKIRAKANQKLGARPGQATQIYVSSYIQLVLDLKDGLSRVPELLRLLLREMHIGDTQHPTPTELGRQAQEHVPTFNPIEPLCKDRDGVDLPLVPKYGPSQVSNRVSNCP